MAKMTKIKPTLPGGGSQRAPEIPLDEIVLAPAPKVPAHMLSAGHGDDAVSVKTIRDHAQAIILMNAEIIARFHHSPNIGFRAGPPPDSRSSRIIQHSRGVVWEGVVEVTVELNLGIQKGDELGTDSKNSTKRNIIDGPEHVGEALVLLAVIVPCTGRCLWGWDPSRRLSCLCAGAAPGALTCTEVSICARANAIPLFRTHTSSHHSQEW